MENIKLNDYIEKISNEFNDNLMKILDIKSEEIGFSILEKFFQDKLNEIQKIKITQIKKTTKRIDNIQNKYNQKSSIDLGNIKKTNETHHKKTPTIIQNLPQKKKIQNIKKSKSFINIKQNKQNNIKIQKENKNLVTKRQNKTPEISMRKKVKKTSKISQSNIKNFDNKNVITTNKIKNDKNQKLNKEEKNKEEKENKFSNIKKMINSNNNNLNENHNRSKTPIMHNAEDNIEKIINKSSYINVIYRNIEPDEKDVIDEVNLRMTINRDTINNFVSTNYDNDKNNELSLRESLINRFKKDNKIIKKEKEEKIIEKLNENKNEKKDEKREKNNEKKEEKKEEEEKIEVEEEEEEEKEEEEKEEENFNINKFENDINSINNEIGDIFSDIYYINTKNLLNKNFKYDDTKIKYSPNKIYFQYISANYYITDEYREIEYNIKLISKAKLNNYISTYSFPLDFVNDVNIIKLINYKVPSNEIKCEIINNQPLIRFSNLNLLHNDIIELKFKVKGIRNEKIIFYTRDYFYITKSAFNSVCDIKIRLGPKLIFFNSKNFILQIDNERNLFYKGIIPKKGLEEIIYLTKNTTRFKISIDLFFFSLNKNNANPLIINMPNQLQGDSTNYNIESYKIKIFQDDFFKESIENPFQNKDQIEITIKNVKREVKINIEMIIENKFVNYINIPNDLISKIQISEEDKKYFSEISKKIIKTSKIKNLPIPIKIAHWVYTNIKYDINYLNKNKTPREIYNNKKGVCGDLSKLYFYLLNSINIKTILIFGLVSDELKRKCTPHSWCIIKYKNKWSSIDPTWKLFSGYLPLSHIFTSFNNFQISSTYIDEFSIKFGDYKIEYLDE